MSAIAEPFLEVNGLHVHYSELVALREVSLTVPEGEVVCIIGPNGAGKSTLLAAIAGGVAPSRGMIRFRGQNIVDTSPEKIARLGLSLVPEGRHIFGSLTVEENLLIGASRRGDRREAAGTGASLRLLRPAEGAPCQSRKSSVGWRTTGCWQSRGRS